MKEWLPVCEHSKLPIDGKFIIPLKDNPDEVKQTYKNLAKDFPQILDFVPSQ